MRALLLPLVLIAPSAAVPAAAAERTIGLGTFERLRVEGPFEVAVTAGSPSARIDGDADAVSVAVDGTTLVVRRAAGAWGEGPRGRAAPGPTRVALSSPALRTVVSQGGARIALGTLKAARIDLTVSGSGAIAIAGAAADELVAAVVGPGSMTLAGRAGRARLLVSGPGAIDADALEAGDLAVVADGTGETRARARYTARVSNTGVGRVTIAGAPKCDVRPATGNVACGVAR